MNTLIIIPAYNEQDSIKILLSELISFKELFIKKYGIKGFDILVVNDSSVDNTLVISKQYKEILFLDLPINLGIGGAVQAGYMFAYRNNYDYAVQVDGDGQHLPLYIDDLVLKLNERKADMVIGSRYLSTNNAFRSTFMRRFGKNLISILIMLLHKKNITDPTSGFRIVNRKLIKFFSDYYPHDYPEPESLAICLRHGFLVEETPVKMIERASGKSSISSIKSAYYMIKVFIAILIDYLKPYQVK